MRFSVLIIAVSMLSMPVIAKPADVTESRKLLAEFATCAVKKRPETAKLIVLENLTSAQIRKDHEKIFDNSCITAPVGRRVEMLSDEGSFKAAFAQALIVMEFKDTAPSNFSTVAPLGHNKPYPLKTVDDRTGKPLPEEAIKKQQEAIDRKTTELAISQLGECIVRLNSFGARNVLSTPMGTDEELNAVKAVATDMSSCIVRGQTVGFNRVTIRNTIAVNYYRLASAAASQGSAK